jgi:hypothetical protein
MTKEADAFRRDIVDMLDKIGSQLPPGSSMCLMIFGAHASPMVFYGNCTHASATLALEEAGDASEMQMIDKRPQ